HVPTEKERNSAEIHYNLGLQAQQAGNIQEAINEFKRAVDLDPDSADAHNALGILLHLSYKRYDEAIKHYERALEVRPNFSEARTNLANVYLDQDRYDEAIKLYEQVLNDMLYPTPFIAQGNLGWAYFKKGDTVKGLENIRAAVTLNPKFCLGYKNLGIIYEHTGNTEESCRQFTRYRESCEDAADAHMHEGVCRAKLGQVDAARERFTTCEQKATKPALQDECRRLREHL
ncbi:MAG TPA: social motility TPR repeat lipoprotein Tgl, partial [Myxococcaceae bacterium]